MTRGKDRLPSIKKGKIELIVTIEIMKKYDINKSEFKEKNNKKDIPRRKK